MPTSTNPATEARKQRAREYAAKYYLEHREQVNARAKRRYASDPKHREANKQAQRVAREAQRLAPRIAYQRGYAAGLRDAAKSAQIDSP